ncbi:MAG: alpha/beta fold hydrolase [Planctomycetota bacterium]
MATWTRARLGVIATCALGAAVLAPTVALASEDPLPRRGYLGVQLGQGRVSGEMIVIGVTPGSGADAAGLRASDVILSINDQPLGRAIMRTLHDGDEAIVRIRRGGDEIDLPITMHASEELPPAGVEVERSEVTTQEGYRLRTIMTMPENKAELEQLPAVFFIQGISCASIDPPAHSPSPFFNVINELTQRGYATLRIEKPGTGDSEGPDCMELGFDEELAGYRAGLAQLMVDHRVDPDRVYIFGISMGGIMAPILADEFPIAGVGVYGTGVRSWHEYIVDTTRGQYEMAGADPVAVESAMRQLIAVTSRIFVDGLSPTEIIAAYPDLAATVTSMSGGDVVWSRHVRFHQELNDHDLAHAWSRVDNNVIVIHGEYDWVALREDADVIVRIVNDVAGGEAWLYEPTGMDHGMTKHDSREDSYIRHGQGKDGAEGLVATIDAWMQSTQQKGG